MQTRSPHDSHTPFVFSHVDANWVFETISNHLMGLRKAWDQKVLKDAEAEKARKEANAQREKARVEKEEKEREKRDEKEKAQRDREERKKRDAEEKDRRERDRAERDEKLRRDEEDRQKAEAERGRQLLTDAAVQKQVHEQLAKILGDVSYTFVCACRAVLDAAKPPAQQLASQAVAALGVVNKLDVERAKAEEVTLLFWLPLNYWSSALDTSPL